MEQTDKKKTVRNLWLHQICVTNIKKSTICLVYIKIFPLRKAQTVVSVYGSQKTTDPFKITSTEMLTIWTTVGEIF